MEVTYTAAQIPVFKWINKEDGREEIAVPEPSPEDLTHISALGSKVTIQGETIAAGSRWDANGKVGFDKPVESGREVKMKVAFAWDVGAQQVFEQIFAQDFKRAKESLAQAGIRLTLVGTPIKIDYKQELRSNTERMKMIQHIDNDADRHNPELLELINAAWTNGKKPSKEPDCIQVIYIRSLSDEGAPKNKMDTSGMAFAPFFINGGIVSPDQNKYPMPNYVNNIFISTNRVERDAGGNSVGIAGLGKPFTLAHEIGHILTDLGHYGTPKAEAGSADYHLDAPVYLRDHNLMRRGTSEYDYFHESKRLYFLQDEILMKRPNNPNHDKFK